MLIITRGRLGTNMFYNLTAVSSSCMVSEHNCKKEVILNFYRYQMYFDSYNGLIQNLKKLHLLQFDSCQEFFYGSGTQLQKASNFKLL